MNIYAKPGSQVKVTGDSFNNGLTENRVDIAKHLKLGKIYTVLKTKVHNFSSEVYLQEVPGVSFNTVNFEDVKDEG